MIGVRLEAEAYIVAAPSAVVQNLIRSVERCNIDVTGIIITPLASSEVLLTRDEKEMGVALVDVGGEITNISIFKNSTLVHTKLIPVGGVHITNDISIGLKIPFSESEILKRQYGCASVSMIKSVEDIAVNTGAGGKKKVSNEELTDIIEARVQEILYLIDKELEASGYKGSIPGGIVITGGGVAFIKGAVEAAYSIIGLPVRVGSPQFIGVASPIYSTGTGIVKYILSSRKYNITGNYTASDESAGVGKSGRKETDKVGKVIKKIKGFFTDFF
jgi:cell division protein FtsA